MSHRRHYRPWITAWAMVMVSSSILSLSRADTLQSATTFNIHHVTRGSLLFSTNHPDQFRPAPTLQTKVNIDVTGMIARGKVIQRFINPGPEWVEGVYVFPLPETAAVDHLRILIGNRRIEGIIQERELAKKTYTAAKHKGHRASLLEQERPNMFTASVANIGPGETIAIEIEYQETLRFNQGQFSLRFPLVVGPRYIPGAPQHLSEESPGPTGYGWAGNTHQVPDASRITPWVQNPEEGLINPVTIEIKLLAGFPIKRLASRFHPISTTHHPNGGYSIALKGREVPSDRDFALFWEPELGHTPQAAVFSETIQDQTYSLIMVLPPLETLSNRIRQSREVIFVIDTSGSMYGTSLDQAKAAVTQALRRLTPRDRVNIIQFNSKTESLFSHAKVASLHTVQQATRYVARLIAEGGTEMLPALKNALQPTTEGTELRQVIFITDGQIGNETALFEMMQQQLRNSRLFTIGIGSAPNSYFMRKAAEFGRGTFTYIGKIATVQEQMNQFFQKLEYPAMTNIQIQSSSLALRDQVPERIPDLYIGEPLMIVMKSANIPEEITIRGEMAKVPWTTSLLFHEPQERRGIAVFWARQKIESLMNQLTGHHSKNGIRQKVIDVALQHHLVSRYTSLVAVDVTPVRTPTESLSTHPLKTNLPHGQNYAAIFGLARGATRGPELLLGGLLCLIVTMGLARLFKSLI